MTAAAGAGWPGLLPVAEVAPPWAGDTALRSVADALGGLVLAVGGAVRVALIGGETGDIDLATPLRPETVIAALGAAGLGAVPTGLAHGTVTAVAEGRGFEITTFRRDVETDGRHATVAFTDDLAADAARRDLTMNALYADLTGRVYDPVGGIADLRAGLVRFIGDPGRRIAEDRLRILRFFRFSAWFARGPLDRAGIEACRAGRAGLAQLSRERVGAEVAKLLAAPDPGPAVTAMAETGVLAAALPGADGAGLAALLAVEAAAPARPAPDWITRLAALGPDDARRDLRLSAEAARALERAAKARALPPGEAAFRLGRTAATRAAWLAAAQAGRPPGPEVAAAIDRGGAARMPLTAADLIAEGMRPGPALGARLRAAEAAWIAADFTLDREALLTQSREKGQDR